MIRDYLFEILIYPCSQEAYAARVRANAEKWMIENVTDYGNGFWQEQLEDMVNRELRPVRYNDLIGGIEVYAVGSQLRAAYWFTDKQKIAIISKDRGTITWQGELLEMHYHQSKMTSEQIFSDFRKSLIRAIKGRKRLRSRYIDFSAFDRSGPLIDWRSALGLQNAENA